jgi:hypothetical protein
MGAQRKRRGSQGDGGIIFRLTEEIVSDSREHRRVRRGLRENCRELWLGFHLNDDAN